MRSEPASPHEHLAAATRRLVDAVLRADLSDDELSAAADATDALVDRLEHHGRAQCNVGHRAMAPSLLGQPRRTVVLVRADR